MPKEKKKRPGMKQIFDDSKVDDGTAAKKLLALYNFCKSKTKVDRNNPQEISDRFVEFCMFCAKNDIVPYWHGFCNSLGYSIWAVDKWKSGETRICDESLQEVKRVHELIQNNILQMMIDGKIRDIAAIYLTKPMDPKFYAVEVMKNSNIQVNVNVGNGESPEQLQEKFIKAIEVPYTEEQDKELVTLPCPDGTRDLKDGQTYNECVDDGQMYTSGGQ